MLGNSGLRTTRLRGFPIWVACGTGPSHWLIGEDMAALSRTLSWNYIAADTRIRMGGIQIQLPN